MAAAAIILAGGDGIRLRPLTRRLAGDDRPKQFCVLLGGDTPRIPSSPRPPPVPAQSLTPEMTQPEQRLIGD
ncbi:MAG: sugar phosphate nucleotidyltransferase [Candidatus Rokuibacteriota bacterium]